nr:hypothetical protein [Solirubrobacter soli]
MPGRASRRNSSPVSGASRRGSPEDAEPHAGLGAFAARAQHHQFRVLGEEVSDERGLADARGALDQDEPRRGVQPLELAVTPGET